MSFFLSTEQFKKRTKDVTRRTGWGNAKPGDVVMGCRKCQGIKPGTLERLGPIIFKSVKSEKLSDIRNYPQSEIAREGFPGKDWFWFVSYIRDAGGIPPTSTVQRIEYAYLDDAPVVELWALTQGHISGTVDGKEVFTSSVVAVGVDVLSVVTSSGSVYRLGACLDELTYMERLLELKERIDIRARRCTFDGNELRLRNVTQCIPD